MNVIKVSVPDGTSTVLREYDSVLPSVLIQLFSLFHNIKKFIIVRRVYF